MSDRAGPAVNVDLIVQAKKRQRMLAREAEDDLKAVAATDAGRRMIFRFLERAHIWQGIYGVDGNGACDTHYTIRLEGERNMGLWLMHEIQAAAPERLMQILNEGLTRDAQERREVSQQNEGGDDE